MTKRAVRRLAWLGVALCVLVVALVVADRLLDQFDDIKDKCLRLGGVKTLAEEEATLGKRAAPHWEEGRGWSGELGIGSPGIYCRRWRTDAYNRSA
jgi:hypothetical protein